MIKPISNINDAIENSLEPDFEAAPFTDADEEFEQEAETEKLHGLEIISSTAKFFEADGPLKSSERFGGRPYEHRPQQADMAVKIAETLTGRHNLCVEAPTGVGKSFAYLIPLIYYSKISPKPSIVSTETINLQEQLVRKDIPLLQKITGIEFKASLAKGRNNYLCRRRLALATGDRRDEYLPLASLSLEMERINKWAENSSDGDRDSIDFRIDQVSWSYVCCEAGNCLGPKCGSFRNCYYWRARREWEDADIVVANHAMFFTDLKIKFIEGQEQNLLPEYSAVVIDEAHTLENNAAEYLGLRINSNGVISFLNRLFNPDNAKGLLMRGGAEALQLRETVANLKDDVMRFFSQFEQYLLERNDTIFRLRQPGLFPNPLSGKLAALQDTLQDYIKIKEDKDYRTELEAQGQKCDAYAAGIADFINMSFADSVYWLEDGRSGITIQAAPLNISELLQETLFKKSFPVILTSATLTVNKKFDYYRERVGFMDGQELRLDSPFDPKQVRVYLPREMPDPAHKDYAAALVEQIPRFISITQGKAFVLFTSYQMLRYCADNLRDFFETNEITLLIQGESLNRSAMLKEFKRDIHSVIFGTDSFWTGVDVPGEALSHVIVTKLPFAVPTHPLIEARGERLEAANRNSFMHYSLPEAVLKFRQGVGRLIRSRTDTGIITILDKRVSSKRYGRYFIDSLPAYPVKYF
ncbi:MAG: helicase C-terminal domain-containing protein [Victivallaceae bacterium]|nr:helicase C-terminal domain-containing protein [Victivallaceae bacterium]